jgi:hypothetical protein
MTDRSQKLPVLHMATEMGFVAQRMVTSSASMTGLALQEIQAARRFLVKWHTLRTDLIGETRFNRETVSEKRGQNFSWTRLKEKTNWH